MNRWREGGFQNKTDNQVNEEENLHHTMAKEPNHKCQLTIIVGSDALVEGKDIISCWDQGNFSKEQGWIEAL